MSAVAVITIVHRRHHHLANQAATLRRSTRPPDLRIVVAMGDPGLEDRDARVLHMQCDPSDLPLASARNKGAEHALLEGADTLIFLDVDCLAGPDLVADYVSAVEDEPDVVWSGPVTYLSPAPRGGYDLSSLARTDDPHPGRPAPAPGERLPNQRPDLFWSLSFAVHARTWSRIGGFCEEYLGYGGEDTDFARLAVDRQACHGWVGGARAYHQHHEVESPPVRHLDAILRNAALFHSRWGEWPMKTWLTEFADQGLIHWHDGRWHRR